MFKSWFGNSTLTLFRSVFIYVIFWFRILTLVAMCCAQIVCKDKCIYMKTNIKCGSCLLVCFDFWYRVYQLLFLSFYSYYVSKKIFY